MPHLIGIGGPSGSGKSLLAATLARRLSAPVIALDSYYRDLSHLTLDERARVNFDEPAALEHELIAGHLAVLGRGGEICVPVYDFATHCRSDAVQRVQAGDFAIIEGLFALNWPEIRRLLGTAVYVDTPDEICFARRLERDMRERGRSEASVREQYAATVRPMAALHVLPTRSVADIVVSGLQPVSLSAEIVIAHALGRVPARG
ncbi:MAG: uridine kinase [bacterium]